MQLQSENQDVVVHITAVHEVILSLPQTGQLGMIATNMFDGYFHSLVFPNLQTFCDRLALLP